MYLVLFIYLFIFCLKVLLDAESKQEVLCSECLKGHFFGGELPVGEIGAFRENHNVSNILI
jgi:hypothetical protein